MMSNVKKMTYLTLMASLIILIVYSAVGWSAPENLEISSPTFALDQPEFSKRISIDLIDISIADVLRYLGDKAGVNIGVSKNVGGRITLSFKDVSIRDALEIALLSNDLAVEKRGEILYITPSEDYLTRYGELWGDARIVRMFKLNYAKPSEVLDILGTIKSEVGNIVVNDESGIIVIMDIPDKITQMKVIISTMDEETLTQVFELKYANAKVVEENLADRLDAKGIGTIKADETTNQVVVTALPGRLEEIERIINELDKKTRQVLIEAKIVKVTLSPDLDMGINWDYIARNARRHQLTLESDFSVPSTVSSLGKLTLGRLATDDYSGTLQMLKTIGETKLLSSPRIAAINNQEASILIGTREAYVTQTITQGQSSTTTSSAVTFIDVGVKLHVTPTINEDAFVTMRIKPEVSSVSRTLTTSDGDEIPIVETTQAETTVMVKDGNTIIIGGLIKDETLRTTRKVPWLGDIPLVGMLFKQIDEDKEKTELIVFLTPRIIEGDEQQKTWEEREPKGLRGYDNVDTSILGAKLESSKPIKISKGDIE